MATATSAFPWFYTLFFLYIEPVATAVGAYYAHLDQSAYMTLTMELARPATSGLLPVSTQESIVLSQLANMYFVFALNEALVLRATTDRRVWNIFLFGLLVADFGHLYSVKAIGLDVYYRFWDWNSMYFGNLGFVYVGATMRTAFLLGLGLPRTSSRDKVKT
ncbi:hypothetical protein DOTSEDRAFT_67523 [Dothistroma septosporum NZE10]|uniref:DUF7704 domain-containing protein n=1 Tax=Dothistroma septosporum (strain NZE10 / CBS 128990) TaxID=675120 RepID=N1Q1I6_DOTSN|nr:hypothetical protein DOTSEDRAFT_67523 [Dothistroma septosporum NZE10]